MFNAAHLARLLRAAGIPLRQSSELAGALGNHQQELKAGQKLEQDTTPKDMRLVTPDVRRHHLTNVDFRKGDPDYRPPKIQDSEARRLPAPDPAVKKQPAPQETDATYNLVDGAYTNAVATDGAVAVNLSVRGSGRAMMLDPPSNSIVGKRLRCEAGGGGNNQNLVRFFIDETGQEVIWKLQLSIERFPIVKKIRYRKGRGIVATVQTAAVFFDPMDREREEVIPTFSQEVVTNLEQVGSELSADKAYVGVLEKDSQPAEHFEFSGVGSAMLCKTGSAWAKGTSATIAVWGGTPLSETATGATVVAYNKFAAVAAGKFCSVMRHNNGQYYLIAAECS